MPSSLSSVNTTVLFDLIWLRFLFPWQSAHHWIWNNSKREGKRLERGSWQSARLHLVDTASQWDRTYCQSLPPSSHGGSSARPPRFRRRSTGCIVSASTCIKSAPPHRKIAVFLMPLPLPLSNGSFGGPSRLSSNLKLTSWSYLRACASATDWLIGSVGSWSNGPFHILCICRPMHY